MQDVRVNGGATRGSWESTRGGSGESSVEMMQPNDGTCVRAGCDLVVRARFFASGEFSARWDSARST